ncbi:hypothetical protein [Streptomyces buecherae]
MSTTRRRRAQSPAPHGADGHDLIRVRGARENNPQNTWTSSTD